MSQRIGYFQKVSVKNFGSGFSLTGALSTYGKQIYIWARLTSLWRALLPGVIWRVKLPSENPANTIPPRSRNFNSSTSVSGRNFSTEAFVPDHIKNDSSISVSLWSAVGAFFQFHTICIFAASVSLTPTVEYLWLVHECVTVYCISIKFSLGRHY